MTRILGLDYGTVRIGAALSDDGQTVAWEYNIFSPKKFSTELPKIIQEKEIEKIVIGLPLNMSGEDSEKTLEVRDFAKKIASQTNLEVILQDERLTSLMAETISGTKKDIDSLSAQIILQNYLDSQKQK